MTQLQKNKNFDLLPFEKNKNLSKKINSFDQSLMLKVKKEIFRIIENCDAVLMHECLDFQHFKGRDVDTFYLSKKKLFEFDEKDLIFHEREKGSYRFLINDKDSTRFINLDFEDVNLFLTNAEEFNEHNYKVAEYCNYTGLKHYEFKIMIFYKIIKYFLHGVVHSYEQLYKLKKILNSLNKNDLKFILNLSSIYLKEDIRWVNKLIDLEFNIYENNKIIKKFWINKRIVRQKKRKVFAGKLKLKNLFKSKKFIYSLFLGKRAKWNKNHRPLPAIAIVGNDGSGKSTIIKYIIQNYSKLDPAHISMRPDTPIIPFIRTFREILKKIIKFSFVNKLYPLKFLLSLIGDSVDLFDRYLKYKIGMAWADSGFGITIFERYITDKIRGEFPNKKSKFLPLEQFFPLPDGFVYLDVLPEITLKRKINERHTLEEMTSKRENYLSLLSEFSETIKITTNDKIEESIKRIKNYIFDIARKKRDSIKFEKKIVRCIWKKNRNRILSGDQNKRFQKDSFL